MEEGDFTGYEPLFFSTSNVGGKGPDIGLDIPPLQDAYDTDLLSSMDVIVSCQGGGYTKRVYPELRNMGWQGYWIDSASTLRMDPDSIIVLDPVNRHVIDAGLSSGTKTYVGGNCTVSLMLMALAGLFASGCVEWVSSMTYQAASGAGANNMKELIAQMRALGQSAADLLYDPASAAIAVDMAVTRKMRSEDFPTRYFSVPLAGSLIPWIDVPMKSGQTREEWKGYVETNKILDIGDNPIPIDGICVRIGAMRCHSQALTVKLDKDIPVDEICDMINSANEWVNIVPNEKESTLKHLSPAAVSGTLKIPVGRLRKMLMGPEYVSVFTVGDQLLWGAAEPVRRALNIILRR
jgi:aspartate-semialdehyde dehydrogenase